VINKHAKGQRTERKARDLLESLGYITDVKNWSRYQAKDFFNMFDIIAILGSVVRLIQIKSNASDFYKARKEIKAWVKEKNIKVPCEIWLYEGKKDRQDKWRIEEL